eukprot:2554776-Prorocentrum_lima.AAC.1
MLDAIKKKSPEHGALAQDLYNQSIDWESKYDAWQKEYSHGMTNLHAHPIARSRRSTSSKPTCFFAR